MRRATRPSRTGRGRWSPARWQRLKGCGMGSVSPDALARLASMQRPDDSRAGGSGRTYDAAATLEAVTADLAGSGIRTTDKPPKPQPDGGRLWELTGCPYSDDHDDSAFLRQYGDGGVHVGCHHERCKGKT